jgi:hypothetical protein
VLSRCRGFKSPRGHFSKPRQRILCLGHEVVVYRYFILENKMRINKNTEISLTFSLGCLTIIILLVDNVSFFKENIQAWVLLLLLFNILNFFCVYQVWVSIISDKGHPTNIRQSLIFNCMMFLATGTGAIQFFFRESSTIYLLTFALFCLIYLGFTIYYSFLNVKR